MEILLENKVVLITGSSRGLGRHLAINFAKAGACVVINYFKSRDKAAELLEEIGKFNDRCMMVYGDVTKSDDVGNMYRQVMERFGRIDVLINNAGITNDDYINLMSESQWDSVISTNLSSVFLCCKYFSKNMVKRKSGRIINIASLKGQLGSEGQANYSASKAAIIGFSKSLAKELGPVGVSVNVVCPGYVRTDLNRDNSNKYEIAKRMSAMSIEYGLDDFTNFMLFLASDLLQGVSGQVYNVDSRIM